MSEGSILQMTQQLKSSIPTTPPLYPTIGQTLCFFVSQKVLTWMDRHTHNLCVSVHPCERRGANQSWADRISCPCCCTELSQPGTPPFGLLQLNSPCAVPRAHPLQRSIRSTFRGHWKRPDSDFPIFRYREPNWVHRRRRVAALSEADELGFFSLPTWQPENN